MYDNNKKTKNGLLFISRGLGTGGAEKNLVFVANECARAGYEVVIITLTGDSTLTIDDRIKTINLNYNSDEINNRFIVNKIIQKIRLLYSVRKYIVKQRPSLIIVFMVDIVRIVTIAVKGLKVKIIGSERANPYGRNRKQQEKYNAAFSKCVGVVFQTEKAMQAYTDDIIRKSYVIPNPAIPRLNKINPFKGERKPIIASAGRLHSQKRFDLLIEAFYHVNKKHPSYILKIFGDGDQRVYLENTIESLGLNDNVFLMGDNEDVFKEINDCSIFVLSSDYEGIPNVLIEALSIGIPSISTDTPPGGAALLLDNGRRGIMVPTGDVEALVNAINLYIENPQTAQKFGELGLEINEELAPSVIKDKWIQLISNYDESLK